MKLLTLFWHEALRILAAWEFRYHKDNVHVYFREKYLRALGVEFTSPVSIGLEFYLRDRGLLKVGRNCSFGSFTRIWNYAPIEIGDHFLSAGGLTMNCGSHDPQTLRPQAAPIKIGDRVWVGLNVTILGGVTIGDDAVIGAGSLVMTDIPARMVYAGVPARKIGEIDRTGLPAIWGAWGDVPRNP